MRICHVVYAHYPADPRVRREVDALRDAGHQVDVIALRDGAEAASEDLHGVRVHRLPWDARRGGRGRYLFQYAVFFLISSVTLLRLHLERRFQVVHVHSLPDFQVFCALPLRLLGVAVILDLHEGLPEIVAARFALGRDSPLVRIARLAERLSARSASRVVTVNDTLRDIFLARVRPRTSITVIMNSSDHSSFGGADAQALRIRLGLDARPTVVYVGGINRERDLATLLRAVKLLRDRFPFRVVIAGPPEPAYLAALRSLADTLGLTDSVMFLPPIPHDQVLAHLALSDLGVLSYENNPLTQVAIPTKAFEYAAVGKPMAIADLRALRDLFRGAAEFFRPGESADLAAAMERILLDPGRASEFVSRAKDVLANCSWDTMRGRLLGLYDELGGETT